MRPFLINMSIRHRSTCVASCINSSCGVFVDGKEVVPNAKLVAYALKADPKNLYIAKIELIRIVNAGDEILYDYALNELADPSLLVKTPEENANEERAAYNILLGRPESTR
jgi:hypothetical protein